jgi:uncharacterized protein YhbP (UPF0306 family)
VSETLRSRIRHLLAAHAAMTLATTGSTGPWASAVFYASDAAFHLYFVTDPRTRHGANLLADARVSAAIHADVSGWNDIRGLQIEGKAHALSEAERATGMEVYLNRFPDVRRLAESPRDDAERRIGERLARIPLWRLAPARIRVIDNREAFGWKEELVL